MTQPSRDELIKKTSSVYKLVILASRRTVELNEGAARLVEVNGNEKPANIALREIAEGRIALKKKEEK